MWNGRKLPVWNVEKSSFIKYHALVRKLISQIDLVTLAEKKNGRKEILWCPSRNLLKKILVDF